MNEHLALSETGGDYSNGFNGNISGILDVGSYSFNFATTSETLLGGALELLIYWDGFARDYRCTAHGSASIGLHTPSQNGGVVFFKIF